jgi:hypothetical protein
LRDIVSSPNSIENVLDCQRILLKEIVRAEGHISRLKVDLRNTRTLLKTSRSTRDDAQRQQRQVISLERRLDAYRQLIYIWPMLRRRYRIQLP